MTTAIDTETFSALRDTTGSEFVRELIDTFLQEAPGMLGDLRQSLDTLDADVFRRAAHSLKSNGNAFGALTLGALAKDLELSGVVQVKGRGAQPLAPLEIEYDRVVEALTALRHE